MIYIDRASKDEHGRLIQPSAHWRRLAAASRLRALAERESHEADRDIYAHASIRMALERLFHFKCAYCESPLEETDWDVEHFRPKKKPAENKNHPGYFWLAYTWTNLYPSCKPCNQVRRDRPIWGDATERPARGKGEQFPLEFEPTRAMDPRGSIIKETRLLLDPCRDKPEKYLSYDAYGEISALNDNVYGAATIAILNLFRRRLVRKRRLKILEVKKALELARDLEASGQPKFAKRMVKFINTFTADNAYHAAVSRAVQRDPEAFEAD